MPCADRLLFEASWLRLSWTVSWESEISTDTKRVEDDLMLDGRCDDTSDMLKVAMTLAGKLCGRSGGLTGGRT